MEVITPPEFSETTPIERHYSLHDVLNRLSTLSSASNNRQTLIEAFNPIVGDLEAREIADSIQSDSQKILSDDNRIELVTVVMLMKIAAEIQDIASSQLTSESYKRGSMLLTTTFGLFKYHFQLPSNHKNYAFKNYGHLLASPLHNILIPTLNFLDLDPPLDHIRIDKLEKIFVALTLFHLFTPTLSRGLSTVLSSDSAYKKLERVFKFDSQLAKKTDFPTFIDLFRRFKLMSPLDSTTFTTDVKFDHLLNSLFFTSFHRSSLQQYVKKFLKHNYFDDTSCDTYIIQLAIESLELHHQSSIALACYHNPNYVNILRTTTEDILKPKDVKDAALFVLYNTLSTLYLNADLFELSDPILQSAIHEYCLSYTHNIMGITSQDVLYPSLTVETLMPLFEFRDQNLKIDYENETVLLSNIMASLLSVNENLDTLDKFVILNNLFVDTGCSLSVSSFFDSLQILLILVIQKVKFSNPHFSTLPQNYMHALGLHYIPPVNRDDASFVSIYDSPNSGTFFKLLNGTRESVIHRHEYVMNILEQSLCYLVTIRFKVLQHLLELNNDTNVLRVLSPFDKPKAEEYPLYKFRNSVSKIGMFSSGNSLDYKLLNPAVELNMMANISLLIVAENYKTLKGILNTQNTSLSRFLNEYAVSCTIQNLLIYREFGILVMFKMLKALNERDLRMIIPTATLISKILPEKQPDTDDKAECLEHGSSNAAIYEIFLQSTICSNLVRQFVETFDDSQSKPFKSLNRFLKSYPSTLKPSKIPKGTVRLQLDAFLAWI